MPTGRVVSKRGGRREPFSLSKLERALQRALEGSGDLPCFASRELALSVEARLPFDELRSVESSAIRAGVERVLEERGAGSLLAAYRRYASRRERQRAQLRVACEGPNGAGRGRSEPFDPARIATHLCLHRGCPRDESLAIAACVERRLLAARWATVGRDLVAAAVEAECRARHLRAPSAARREVVGPRRAEVDELLEVGCTSGGTELTSWGHSVEQALSSLVLARHASRGGAGLAAAEAHAQGDLHFLHFDAPHRRVGATAWIAPETFDAARFAEGLAEALALQTRRATLLVDLRAACAGRVAWKRARLALEAELPVWGAIARAAGARLGLLLLVGRDDSRGRSRPAAKVAGGELVAEGALLELVRALDRPLAERPQVWDPLELAVASLSGARGSELYAELIEPLVRGAGSELPPLRFGSLDRANLGFAVAPRGGLAALPGPEVGGAWHWGACGGVALDLPRLASGVGPADEGAFFGALHALLELGVEESQRQAARHERRSRACLGPAIETPGGAGFAVVPIGFHEALQILWGEVAAPRAARALSFLSEAIERCGRQAGTDWFLELGDAPEVRGRFERLDDARDEGVGTSGYAWATRDGRRYGFGVAPARGGPGPLDRHLPGLLAHGRTVLARHSATGSIVELAPLDARGSADKRNDAP